MRLSGLVSVTRARPARSSKDTKSLFVIVVMPLIDTQFSAFMAAARIVRSPSPTFYYLSLFLAFPDIATNGQSDTEMIQVVTGPANGFTQPTACYPALPRMRRFLRRYLIWTCLSSIAEEWGQVNWPRYIGRSAGVFIFRHRLWREPKYASVQIPKAVSRSRAEAEPKRGMALTENLSVSQFSCLPSSNYSRPRATRQRSSGSKLDACMQWVLQRIERSGGRGLTSMHWRFHVACVSGERRRRRRGATSRRQVWNFQIGSSTAWQNKRERERERETLQRIEREGSL